MRLYWPGAAECDRPGRSEIGFLHGDKPGGQLLQFRNDHRRRGREPLGHAHCALADRPYSTVALAHRSRGAPATGTDSSATYHGRHRSLFE